jgi:hypothetical protein
MSHAIQLTGKWQYALAQMPPPGTQRGASQGASAIKNASISTTSVLKDLLQVGVSDEKKFILEILAYR